MKVPRNPVTVHSPVASYIHQIEVTGSRRWLVLSGQVGQRPDGTVPEDPVEQINIALANVSSNLEAARMRLEDVVKLTIYLVGDIDIQRRREAVDTWLADHKPCMTLLFVTALAAPQYRVEIDAWACAEETSA